MKKAKIIVLAGQSNAVGVGQVRFLKNHFTEERIQKWYDGYPNVQMNYFSHDKKSGGFVDTTVGCTEVAHYSGVTMGPELGIAEVLTERYPGETIYIVKCAFGGMSLYKDWRSPSCGAPYDPEAYADQKENIISNYDIGAPIRAGWCYNELVRIMKDSIRILEEAGLQPCIKGFCWMQGESDADTLEHVNQYAYLYHCLLKDFNETFAPYLEDCVYVDGGISVEWNYYEAMNAVKRGYNETHENCYFIDTLGEGFTTRNEPPQEPDIWHYDTDCVIKLGHRFAQHIDL